MALDWNLADLFELVAESVPDRPALAHGSHGVSRSWRELDRRADALAAHWLRQHAVQDKLAIYSHNRPEFMETFVGALKARLVPVNVNYRYREAELIYLLDNSDATVVVYETEFADRVAAIRERTPKVREWIEICEDRRPANDFAIAYEELASSGAEPERPKRSPSDLIFVYTGGTTGMPKGVMWEQKALWNALGGGGSIALGEAPSRSREELRERILDEARTQRLLPACPLMHGTGLFTSIGALGLGGAVVTLTSHSLDAEELWSTVEARDVNTLSIVGDVFARPMLRALDDHPGRWKLGGVRLIISSGTMWSPEVKQGLLRHMPQVALFDSFGASEAVGFGSELTTRDRTVRLGRFRIGPNCKVFTPDGREVQPGSSEVGFVARSGPIPLGYYKDERKTAETFKVIQGVRWAIPGDWCRVNPDGTLDLLGRGSVCINTGGEKVYPEEVEEVLKTHARVADAVVVGVPDPRWGEAVTAVVQLEPGAEASEEELRRYVRERLAGYKTPKRVVFVSDVGRAPNGKADYRGARERAMRALGLAAAAR